MLSTLLEGIGNALAESLLQIVFYFVGRIFIPIISLGRWHCEPALDYERLLEDLAVVAERRDELTIPHQEFVANLKRGGIV